MGIDLKIQNEYMPLAGLEPATFRTANKYLRLHVHTHWYIEWSYKVLSYE